MIQRAGSLLILVVIGILLALALVLPEYRLGVLALIATYAIAALAQNLLAGYADVPSLGNVAFFAVSAYVGGSLVTLAHAPVILSLLLGVVASGVVGLIIGVPALRISGMHLAIVTLVMVFAAQELMRGWDQSENIPSGLTVSQPAWLLGERGLYIAAIVASAICYLLVWKLVRSRIGRALVALSDNPIAAASVGINGTLYQLGAFMFSGLLTGTAGIVYLYYTQTVRPETFPIDLSLTFLTMMILGGSRSVGGSLLGALIIGFLPQVLGLFPAYIGQLRLVDAGPGIYAGVLLVTLRFFPDGLWNGIAHHARHWRHSDVERLEERHGARAD